MKIAAYGIAKNEENNITSWYESIKDADYILLLDTGSTDKTIEIAKSLGIDVRQAWFSPWDETTAKNVALSLIPIEYDYCLNIDIDQIINTKNWREILENSPEYMTYSGNLVMTTGLGAANVLKDLTFIHKRTSTYWYSYRPIITCNNELDVKEKRILHLDIDIIDMPGTQERFDNREDLYIQSFKNAVEKIEKIVNHRMLKGMYLNLSLAFFEKEYANETIKYYLKYLNSTNNKKDISVDNFMEFAEIDDKIEVVMLLAISLLLPQHTNEIYNKIINAEKINEYWKFFISLRKCIIYFYSNNIEMLNNEFENIRYTNKFSYKESTKNSEYTVMNISETEISALEIIDNFLKNESSFNYERADYLLSTVFSNIHYGKQHKQLAYNNFKYFKQEGF